LGNGESWDQITAQERITRVNEITFASLSSLQQEMLTYNLDKSMIRSLVKKICATMTSFPDSLLQQMLKKIDDYDQKPFAVAPQSNAVQSQATRTILEAHRYLNEP
jgi:hypothetical protein